MWYHEQMGRTRKREENPTCMEVQERSGFTGYQPRDLSSKRPKSPGFWSTYPHFSFIGMYHGWKSAQLRLLSCPIPSVPCCWSTWPQGTCQSYSVQCWTNDRWLLHGDVDSFHPHVEGHTFYHSMLESTVIGWALSMGGLMSTVAEHFNSRAHLELDMTVMVIFQSWPVPTKRLGRAGESESWGHRSFWKWISRLITGETWPSLDFLYTFMFSSLFPWPPHPFATLPSLDN